MSKCVSSSCGKSSFHVCHAPDDLRTRFFPGVLAGVVSDVSDRFSFAGTGASPGSHLIYGWVIYQ